MKKIVSFALCALSFAAFGASLLSFDKLQDGSEIKPSYPGKLVSVDVFSDQSSGTVKLSRIFRSQSFTNAYDVATDVYTNVSREAVYQYDYVRGDGMVFTNAGVEVFSEYNKTYYWLLGNQAVLMHNTISGWWYSSEWDETDGRWARGENLSVHQDSPTGLEFGSSGVSFNRRDTLDHYNYTTNIVTVVTTNAIIPVVSGELVVTNEIMSGSCSAKSYHGAPASDTYIFGGDRLLFNGTATGGSLRIVIE